MPTSKITYGLPATYIEKLHDYGIAITWPGLEPVGIHECLDENLLHSAATQPFQSGFGIEFYPTIIDKAAYLFFSIAGGHIFSNGNKRTAILAVDQFLMANRVYLLLTNEEIKTLAEQTASYRIRQESPDFAIARIRNAMKTQSVEFRHMRNSRPGIYKRAHESKRVIRRVCIPYPTGT